MRALLATGRARGTALGTGLVLLALGARAAAGPAAAPPAATIHPAVGDTLDAGEAARFGLLADVPGLRRAVLAPAPWGGYVARIELAGPDGPSVRERNVTTAQLRAWQAQIEAVLAGFAPPPPVAPPVPAATAPADSAAAPGEPGAGGRVRVWPEVPLPSGRPRPPGLSGPGAPPAPEGSARPANWLIGVGLGYRHCASDFSSFFTDQGLFELSVQHRLTPTLTPYFAFEVGFGDIQDDFEAISADGRSATYALELGLLARAAAGRRSWVYAGAGAGYYMRSLRWGGDYFYAPDGTVTGGTLVWELQDFGFALRAGVQLPAGGKGRRERLLDIQIRYEDYAPSELSPFGPEDDEFYASGRDRWLALSVGLVTRL